MQNLIDHNLRQFGVKLEEFNGETVAVVSNRFLIYNNILYANPNTSYNEYDPSKFVSVGIGLVIDDNARSPEGFVEPEWPCLDMVGKSFTDEFMVGRLIDKYGVVRGFTVTNTTSVDDTGYPTEGDSHEDLVLSMYFDLSEYQLRLINEYIWEQSANLA